MRHWAKLIRDNRGATAIEYALIASMISVAALAAFQDMGAKVDSKYQSINQAI